MEYYDDESEWEDYFPMEDYIEPEPPTEEEIQGMFKRARARWPHADDRSIANYVNMKLDGYGELQCQIQSGFADPPGYD